MTEIQILLLTTIISLDALETRGVLQKNNRHDLEDLVNSATEIIEGEESSEEICAAVLQRCAEENAIVIDSDDEERVLQLARTLSMRWPHFNSMFLGLMATSHAR